MRPDLLPSSIEGKLIHLVQECAEVQKAVTKLMMFGCQATDEVTGIKYDNVYKLFQEMEDLEGALSQVRNHVEEQITDLKPTFLKERQYHMDDAGKPVREPPKPHQLWTHYNGGLYLILAVGRMEADLVPCVVYRQFNTVDDSVWVRSLSNFMEDVGDGVHRFVQEKQ